MGYELKHHTNREIREGSRDTLGAVPGNGGTNFAIYSQHAVQVFLLLFDAPREEPTDIIELIPDREQHRWHVFVKGVKAGQLYGYKIRGQYDPAVGLRFNEHKLLIDPYAKALTTKFIDSDGLSCGYQQGSEGKDLEPDLRDSSSVVPKSIVIDDVYDWDEDRPPRITPDEMIIYEMHVKGFTADPASGVAFPGTFAGIIEKIPYLKNLGVNTVELLPVHEYHIREELVQRGLTEYWGYNTIGFFAPESSYGTGSRPGCQVDEFKTLVRELHRAGMEIILDVVYNHTGEGGELGPTVCFRGVDNTSYYMLQGPAEEPKRYYRDETGCKNTLDIEKPAVLRLVLDSLRYWTSEMHVDGFRFDLAPILVKTRGAFNEQSAFFKAIAEDPVLRTCKMIAEPWDPAGSKTGSFPHSWMEWNDRFRDRVRKFLKGDSSTGSMAKSLTGSQDIFGKEGKTPCSSINFITAHDGFTLYDLYSYGQKHNLANGEENRDGSGNNNSWNCGVEGDTDDREVLELRKRMVRNALCALFFSRGVPMLLCGDEVLRTQGGNNNAYCHDSPLSWFPWELVKRERDVFEFCQQVIAIRKRFPVLGACSFFTGESTGSPFPPDIRWYDNVQNTPDWDNPANKALCCEIYLGQDKGFLFLIFNAGDEELDIRLPSRQDLLWFLVCDTAAVYDGGAASIPGKDRYTSSARSVAILHCKPVH